VGVAIIAAGLDTSLLTRLSSAGTTYVEQGLIAVLRAGGGATANAAPRAAPALSGPLAALADAQWLNEPLAADALRGKVVLVNFWTYSCINCLRTLPYVRAWAARYRDRGLVVVGVHTPEFAFERDPDNVRRAAAALGVTYPVAIDNQYAI